MDAILAKLSEPKNLRGFTIMDFPLSSKINMPTSSEENACLTSLMSRCFDDDEDGATEAAGGAAGPVAALSDLETSARSPEITFSTLSSSSTFWANSSRLIFSSPRAYSSAWDYFVHKLLFCFVLSIHVSNIK
jgi:hypothetical protein